MGFLLNGRIKGLGFRLFLDGNLAEYITKLHSVEPSTYNDVMSHETFAIGTRISVANPIKEILLLRYKHKTAKI